MTQAIYAGTDFTFGVDLPSLADEGTVTWTLRDQAAVPIVGAVGIAIPNAAGADTALVPTTALQNTKGATPSENRFLALTWLSSGATQTLVVPYILIDWMPLRVQATDVISIVGLNDVEVTPEEIDIPSSALYVKLDVGSDAFDAALIAGDITTNQVNQLVALHAAIELAPSMQLRIADSIKTDTAGFQRYKGLDVDSFVDDLWGHYARVKLDFLPNAVVVQPNLVSFSAHNRDPMIYPRRLTGSCLTSPAWLPNFLLP
jgi:hypothetical protein